MIAAYTEGDEPVPGFRLAKLLACETFGSVWKATGPGGLEACIKIVSLVNKQRLKEFSALRLVKHVRHPNLVPILAFWLKDKQGNFIDESLVEDVDCLPTNPVDLIMVMGLGDKSLFDLLKEYQKLGHPGIPPQELLNYMEDVAEALDHLNQPIHDLGDGPSAIQHCDIKPHNILLVGSAAQVCDLGGARTITDARATSAVGSAAYMAPEYITEGIPSRSTDQYSLAVCYVELRTGSLPLNAKSAAAAYLTHIRGALDLSLLTPEERAVVARATSVRADNRFPTCRALVHALREACGFHGRAMSREKESSNPNINLLAGRKSMSTPLPVPQARSLEPAPLVPDPTSKPEEPSDESVDLAGPLPDREHDTLRENMSLVARSQSISFPPREALVRTAVVEVNVVANPSTADDEDDNWPTELDTLTHQASTSSMSSTGSKAVPPPKTPPATEDPGLAASPEQETLMAGTPAARWPRPRIQILPLLRQRRWVPVPVAIACSAFLGIFAAWLARNPAASAESSPTDPSDIQVVQARPESDSSEHGSPTMMPPAELSELPAPPRSRDGLPPFGGHSEMAAPGGPFMVQSGARAFPTLEAAVAAASSGDTIEIQEDGPFTTGPLEIRDKELTIQAAPGHRPIMELGPRGSPSLWQPLFLSDRRLTLAGLQLRRATSENDPVPAHLVKTVQAPLFLRDCHLDVPLGSAAIVCTNPGLIDVRDCMLVADALGLCVEVGDGKPCEINMIGNWIRIQDPRGAAFSIWAPEVRQSSAVHFLLERNTISAGRIAAFKSLPRPVEIIAEQNDFAFREALLSLIGFADSNDWHRAAIWREHKNHYDGPADWLRVNGRPTAISGLAGWKEPAMQ